MKVVINKCYGGFSLSRKAVARIAELQGRPCYFFTYEPQDMYTYIPAPKAKGRDLFISAFDIPNPNEVLISQRDWHSMTMEEKEASSKLYEQHKLSNRDYERNDPLLIQVVEELGKEANGECADLKIVEIPDNVKWEISEYDGLEHVAQQHETWG